MGKKNKRASKPRRRPSSEGYAVSFHGSYRDKAPAENKAKKRGGFVISRVPRGTSKRRYIVCAERVPF